MIRIQVRTVGSDICTIEISGHAMAGPYGQDLVCAGVSAIALSSLNAIDELYRDACKLSANQNKIVVYVQKNSSSLQEVLKFLVTQLDMMKRSYPDHIRLEKSSKQ